jgi:hypothetical protein
VRQSVDPVDPQMLTIELCALTDMGHTRRTQSCPKSGKSVGSQLADSQPIVLSGSPVLRAEIPHTIGTPGCPTVSYRPDPTE